MRDSASYPSSSNSALSLVPTPTTGLGLLSFALVHTMSETRAGGDLDDDVARPKSPLASRDAVLRRRLHACKTHMHRDTCARYVSASTHGSSFSVSVTNDSVRTRARARERERETEQHERVCMRTSSSHLRHCHLEHHSKSCSLRARSS